MKYILTCLIAMIPIVELRGAIPIAIGWGVDPWVALVMCTIANMLPVPFIYFFARKFLLWGQDKPYIGKFFSYCIEKGEHGGHRLKRRAGRGGLFIALMLFVGIPLPGTGAWTGSLIAALLEMDIKKAVIAELVGIVIATIIMSIVSYGLLGLFI